MKFEWKLVDVSEGEECFEFTNVSKVFGGWIVRACREQGRYEDDDFICTQVCESSVFVPDPNHVWEIEEFAG